MEIEVMYLKKNTKKINALEPGALARMAKGA